jgi:hypothetical protein
MTGDIRPAYHFPSINGPRANRSYHDTKNSSLLQVLCITLINPQTTENNYPYPQPQPTPNQQSTALPPFPGYNPTSFLTVNHRKTNPKEAPRNTETHPNYQPVSSNPKRPRAAGVLTRAQKITRHKKVPYPPTEGSSFGTDLAVPPDPSRPCLL